MARCELEKVLSKCIEDSDSRYWIDRAKAMIQNDSAYLEYLLGNNRDSPVPAAKSRRKIVDELAREMTSHYEGIVGNADFAYREAKYASTMLLKLLEKAVYDYDYDCDAYGIVDAACNEIIEEAAVKA